MKTFYFDSKVQRTKDVVSSDIDGETVMMSIEQGKYYGMDSIGSRIWELIKEPITMTDLCCKLVDEFDIDIPTCTKDVMKFMEQMDEEHLIKVVDEKDM